ncbi:D-alanine--D-alanine ligase [Nocardioides marmoriginsengisoli]|uniref:D-alanine--D-alanine ligase n=1 Tax=Nocardioides marmoriginsengisoli TaxID=661483 RepID=A0A3N0CEZ2_9ACTN|nr:D-alanine--D-alanine ligase [Nocardioides marmoriginsengisoli]RNL62027.1 D-alanine--D-alanine ligase [Nocardioides marmoriginsengisoli]
MIRVAVIGGGQNCEHEVSLASAASASAAFDRSRFQVVELTIGVDGSWSHGAELLTLGTAIDLLQTCDAVLPLVHGPRGEDGTLAALCELAGVPCVGSGLGAGALAMDKWVTKLIAQAHGIGVADGVLLTAATAPSYGWDGVVVVKPVAAGSSQGVSLVREERDLAAALDAALALDDRVLVEEVVVGREIDLAVLGRPDGSRVVAPALEIVVDGFFDFDSKYGGSADFRIPAAIDAAELKGLEDAAVTMYDALGCAGVARVDFFLTESGPVLNEVNTIPGFTEQSQAPKMFAAAGTPYPELLELLVRDALAGD